MVDLTAGDERFRDDSGLADPAVTQALAAYADGRGGEHAVLIALAGSRLLVPVLAVRADDVADSEMATPEIIGRDGRRALPAFTSLAAVQRWQPEARPVPVPALGVWQSAAQSGSAVVVDIAGPVPLVVEGSRLAVLAAGQPPPGLHEDQDSWRLVAAAAAEVAPGIRIRLRPPKGGLDFGLELAPPVGAAEPVSEAVAKQVAGAVQARLASRARAGFVVIRVPAS